jgi:uncharacterized membrane protein
MVLWLKLLHVTAAVLFLGNIITGLFWHAHADRTRDAKLLFHTMDGIIRSDRWFTNPCAVLLTLAGVLLAMKSHLPILGTPWILRAIVLFALSGLLFVVRVAPLQKRLRELARIGMAADRFDGAGYRRVATAWDLWGAVSLVLSLGALAFMVLKPAP